MEQVARYITIFFMSISAFSQIGETTIELMHSDITGDPVIGELDSTVTRYNYHNPVEKVYLHTVRDLFTSGENLWYKAYVVLGGRHEFSLASKVVYIDLIGPNNKILVAQTNELSVGKAFGSIALPKNLSSGNYQLRAYTNWMRNFGHNFFFTKTIKVEGAAEIPVQTRNISDKIDLQFFPEGGHAVAGLMGRVAFKAIGSDGLDRKIRGYLKDSQGKTLINLNTLTRGSGTFHLQPKLGENYIAILDDGSEYPFPKITDQGYVMSINNTDQKNIKVEIQATERLNKEPFYILGQINNLKYFHGKYEFENQEAISFEIPKNEIPSGVLVLTLFDRHKKPWCERVVFINNREELVIDAKVAIEKISKRNEIVVDLNVTDSEGKPVSTELSLSITDAGQVVKNPYSGNILTHLLLQSDIKGHISNPGLLFKNQNKSTLYALDLVMLTHGWRKFPWQEIQEGSLPVKKFDFEKGLSITGKAKGKLNKPLKNVDLNIIAKSGETLGMLSAKTDRDGKFLIPDFNFRGITKAIFSAYDQKNRQLNLKVVLDSNDIVPPIPQFKNISPDNKGIEEHLADYSVRREMSSFYKAENTVELEEVVVTKIVAK